MKLLLKFIALCSLTVILPGFAMGITVADLIDKAKLKDSDYEKKIGDYIKIETVESPREPKLIKAAYYTKGIKTRSDMRLLNKGKQISSITIYDGKYKWTITGNMKIKSQQYAANKLQNVLKSKKLLEYLNKDCKIEKMEKFNGKNCYVISAKVGRKSEDNGKVLMWIDKDNYNTYAQLFLDKSGKESARTLYSDFRNICEGVSVPFKTEVYIKGKLFSRDVIKSYKVNQKLSDDLFDASKYKVPELSDVLKNMKERQKALGEQPGEQPGEQKE
jgi:outer membrane lipoprotein-sorting protein